jgi:hypothetical protein
MVINRTHLPWFLLVVVLTLAMGVLYMEAIHPGSVREYLPAPQWLGLMPPARRSIGATPLGVIYGTVAFLIFIFASLLGARKKVRHWRIGSAQAWLRAHIWLSILTVPLVLFHCGFHMGSLMTSGLMVLYTFVMVSGFYGLALQQFMPRMMTERLEREFIHDEIPYIRKQLTESALDLRETMLERKDESAGVIRGALENDVLPYLLAARGKRHRLCKAEFAEYLFRTLRVGVVEDSRSGIDEMERWCTERRQIDAQLAMHRWLHYWLFLHAPASLALIVWTAWHAVSGLYFY